MSTETIDRLRVEIRATRTAIESMRNELDEAEEELGRLTEQLAVLLLEDEGEDERGDASSTQ